MREAPPGSEMAQAINRIGQLEAENRALAAESERVGRILESASDYAIITLDSGSRITGWFGGARRILGYNAADVLGKCFSIFVAPESRDDHAFELESCRDIYLGRVESQGWRIRQDGSRFWGRGAVMPLLDAEGRANGDVVAILRDGSDIRERDEQHNLLMAEMTHRIENVFYTVRALSTQSWWFASSANEFQIAFESRLLAVARAQDRLLSGGQDAHLAGVVGDALAMYLTEPNRATMRGSPVLLTASQVTALTLMFHELRTNAEKHGAFSTLEGLVDVTWTLERSDPGEAAVVTIVWQEREGPTTSTPKHKGFGSYLLGSGFVHFGSSVNLEFHPAGLRCRITLPIGTARSISNRPMASLQV